MSYLVTPIMGLRYLTVGGTSLNEDHVDGQTPSDIAYAEDLILLDMATQCSVVDRTVAAQPGSPTELDLYALPASPTGTDWAGNDNSIAGYYEEPLNDGSFKWYFLPVWVGFRIYDRAASQECRWNGTTWTVTHP